MAEPKMTDSDIVKWILACRDEAEEAKRSRMTQNRENYDAFHLKHDFSHKEDGQSTEVLARQPMAVEQIRSFFQQALVDAGDWWSAEACYPTWEQAMLVKPHEITKLTNYMLEKGTYFSHVGSEVQSALLGALAISKTFGCMKTKPRFVSRKKGRGKSLKRWLEKIEDKTWELKFKCIRHEDYYPDPTGQKLYEIEDMEIDYYEMLRMAEGDDAIYDKEVVSQISVGTQATETASDKSRETGQNTTNSGHRPVVKITEFWGTILDSSSGEIVYENVVAAIANDTYLIRKPEPNPLWHQESPYTVSGLLEVANSVWHKALMDAPTKHSHALTELYNLLVDAAMKQVHAVSQLRKDNLDNPAQVANGIKPGSTLVVNSGLQPGAKVLEPLTSVVIPAEALNIFNIQSQEFNSSSLTNDLRSGVMPFRAVKATEVVEASQTITSVFQGVAKNFEVKQIVPELEKSWKMTAQNWDRIDKEVFIGLFGPERGEELSQLSPQDVFASTVSGVRFRVYGISLTLAKSQDFRKLTQLLQIVFGNPLLAEQFLAKYDPGKLLGEVMTSLDIDKHKLEIPEAVQMTMQEPQQGDPMQAEMGGPDVNSQIPQAGAGSLSDMMGTPSFPQSEFPGSPAIPGGN